MQTQLLTRNFLKLATIIVLLFILFWQNKLNNPGAYVLPLLPANTTTQLPVAPTPTKTPVIGETYSNDTTGLVIFYARALHATCCDVIPPTVTDVQKIVSFSTEGKPTETPHKQKNAATFYLANKLAQQSFFGYVENQADQLLKLNERFNKQTSKPTKSTRIIGDKQAIVLRGYTWWADFIYLPLNNNKVLIITESNENTINFELLFENLLDNLQIATTK